MNKLMLDQLKRIVIKGFKSIKECDLELGNINVLIGSNGAGKSNFISVFEMLQYILEQELRYYVGKKGGANSLLYNGKKVTNSILVEIYINSYLFGFDLFWVEDDGLLFREERVEKDAKVFWGNGYYRESKFKEVQSDHENSMDIIQNFIKTNWRIYHFHDTSASSKMKSRHTVSNCDTLMRDASNLAAFLYRLREHYNNEYKNILHAIQMVAPYFNDFFLKPEEANNEYIILRWQQKNCDDIFYASQLSDGTLRFICLAALLLQPSKLQPTTIIIDEPELGLHPFAITIFSEMVHKVAANKQIILSTQSVELLDHFDVEDVVVVDNKKNGSEFKRLDIEKLKIWLEDDYTLGELWNKNLFGGRLSQ